jgi:hypothetical protein
VGEAWQLDEVTPRQVLFDLSDLILDHVRVVEQPLFRGGGGTRPSERAREDAVRLGDPSSRFRKAFPERALRELGRRFAVSPGDLGGVLRESVGGVELAAQQGWIVPRGVIAKCRTSPAFAAGQRFNRARVGEEAAERHDR